MCASPEPAESRVITTEDSIAMADTPAAADVPKMIRIDKLVARHEPAPPGPLGVPVKTLIAQYEKIPTATVSDVLREHGLLDCAFPGSLVPLFTPWWGAPGAAWAVLLASGMGAIISLRLLQRWQMPHSVARPYAMVALAAGSYLLSLYLPIGWPWRLLIGSVLYLLLAWRTQLVAPQDWQLVRRVVLQRDNQDSAAAAP